MQSSTRVGLDLRMRAVLGNIEGHTDDISERGVMKGNQKKDIQAIVRVKKAVALFCLAAAGLYYAFLGKKEAAGQGKTEGMVFLEAASRGDEAWAGDTPLREEVLSQGSGQLSMEQCLSPTEERTGLMVQPQEGFQQGGIPTETAHRDADATENSEISPGNQPVGDQYPYEAPVPGIPEGSTGEQSQAADGRIDLNMASLEELDTLPGIGPSTAQLIIAYRESYGGFAAIEEIKNVKRIGDKTFEKIKHLIVVR